MFKLILSFYILDEEEYVNSCVTKTHRVIIIIFSINIILFMTYIFPSIVFLTLKFLFLSQLLTRSYKWFQDYVTDVNIRYSPDKAKSLLFSIWF